ncbi:hypothetical protein DM872_06590 [Pseudomonas taiwanensis]|uniref:EAL domain-containing protein n=1 Tax=Pseudomonas taiwanensis TaxID=470150 RepID=UPI0015B87CC9|nr:EAL domain-containing protein [Pseudomonas taiwanensis]NWL76516.1 hypothetical protein [Pseudomonas taiwanensis]
MYEAKSAGRNTWRLHSESMDQLLVAKKHRELELRTALRHGKLELYYQPRHHTRDRTISAVEALIRWNLFSEPMGRDALEQLLNLAVMPSATHQV